MQMRHVDDESGRGRALDVPGVTPGFATIGVAAPFIPANAMTERAVLGLEHL
jgi:hypothetical protein